nr:CHAP domain-containing protein [Herbihabitans rhizosphaerae]
MRKWQEGGREQGSWTYQQWFDPANPDNWVDWCAQWVSWIFAQAGQPLPDMQTYGGDTKNTGFQHVPAAKAWAKAHGWYHEGTTGIQTGDVVTIDWEGDGESNHTGIVTKVHPDGSFETIEGNTSPTPPGDMTRQTYQAGDPNIEGYLRREPHAGASVGRR